MDPLPEATLGGGVPAADEAECSKTGAGEEGAATGSSPKEAEGRGEV